MRSGTGKQALNNLGLHIFENRHESVSCLYIKEQLINVDVLYSCPGLKDMYLPRKAGTFLEWKDGPLYPNYCNFEIMELQGQTEGWTEGWTKIEDILLRKCQRHFT